MGIEIRVPALGESISEATVANWLKKPGDTVKADEPLVELETDKVAVEVPSPTAGVLEAISAEKGAVVAIGALLGSIKASAGASAPVLAAKPAPKSAPVAEAQPSAPAAAAKAEAPKPAAPKSAPTKQDNDAPLPPSSRKALAEAGLDANGVAGTGKRGQVLKEDALAAVAAHLVNPEPEPIELKPSPSKPAVPAAPTAVATKVSPIPSLPMAQLRLPPAPSDAPREERVKLTRLRQTIARRLKDAQNTAAMLTTFNDVDMSAVMAMRATYKELFEKRHGVKLGFMGFFVKACIQALRDIPSVNAEIDGDEIVYKNYYHIGVAVGTERGLVVPVLREADRMSLAEVETQISDYGKRARDGKLTIEDMLGGTFTISNGGVYGSMLSTPILNAPQSGILGMHRIEDRAVVKNGQIVARPMMYLALSYDHRLVDGREAVSFLVRVKECLEDPQRFILEL
jgi:2-oxoglutarate dehydrogenase E2 component (dihydrolipoamide succinyltransferase)